MFDDGKLYLTNSPELKAIAPYSTLAHWRSEGRGPAYVKLGARVAYSGEELNRWMESRTVRPGGNGDKGEAL